MSWRLDQVHDALVVGSGAAGLMFAIELAKTWDVTILTKSVAEESSTKYAQGGIAAVLSVDDDYEKHIEDTLRAGDHLCDPEVVRLLVQEAPARIRDLMLCGVEFDRMEDNSLLFTREGGHRSWRVLHVGDMTGKAIEEALQAAAARNPRIHFVEHFFVLDLVVADGVCFGVIGLDSEGQVQRVLARTIFLATGGAGQLYSHTTNPVIATGDGLAMAHRAGCRLEDLEFIQFHPTAFCAEGAPFFLISEAVRGEGGRLLDAQGRRFMPEYHPDAELAPRDIVSRAIFEEIRRSGIPNVFLDVSHLPADFLRRRFPTIHQRCLEFGCDITKEPIPVAPAAHYVCGGVKTDIDGKTDLISLYAGGEVARTGVHGANRLASNSLLESVVFAYRAAVNADRYLRFLPRIWHSKAEEAMGRVEPPRGEDEADPEEIEALIRRIQETMWRHCGIVRSFQGLAAGAEELARIAPRVHELQQHCRPTARLQELVNLHLVAGLVVDAAARRRKNAGTHFNIDCVRDPGRRSPRGRAPIEL
jgi:L-aspartate oxidase